MARSGEQAVADELERVCRPGGTIGMLNFTPRGTAAEFFGLLGRYTPPPPEAPSPLLWGSDEHVRALFGDRLDALELRVDQYVERSASPEAWCDLFEETFGPLIAIRAGLAGEPARLAALEREFHEFAARAHQGPAGGPAEHPYEYLLAVGRERGA